MCETRHERGHTHQEPKGSKDDRAAGGRLGGGHLQSGVETEDGRDGFSAGRPQALEPLPGEVEPVEQYTSSGHENGSEEACFVLIMSCLDLNDDSQMTPRLPPFVSTFA